MLLMHIEEYRMKYYTDASRPSRRRLLRWIQQGKLPAKKQGVHYFVDIHLLEKLTGNALVDKFIVNL